MDERPETVAAFVQEVRGEVELCPNCFDPVFPGLTFCHTCMAPVSPFAGYGPFERIWASAWIAWKATWSVGVRPWHGWVAWGAIVMLAAAQLGWVALFVTWELDPWEMLAFGLDPLMYAVIAQSILFTALQMILAWRVILNVRRVAAGRHPGQLADVFGEEWSFGDWDEETGFPVGHNDPD